MLQEKVITIDQGRDQGKTFRVREMPVSRLEKWCGRALLAAFGSRAPANVAELAQSSNAAALATAGLSALSGVTWEAAEPLYDALLEWIDRIPDPNRPRAVIRLCPANLDAHVEDMTTIVRLRGEVLGLSLGFLAGGVDWTSRLSALLAPRTCVTTSTSPAA